MWRVVKVLTAVWCGVLLALAAVPSAASSAPGPFALPAPVNTGPRIGGDEAVAEGAAGDRAVIWRNRVSPYESYLSVRRALPGSAGWGKEERVGERHPWQYFEPRVAVDASGGTTVAWQAEAEFTTSTGQQATSTGIWATHARRGEAFATPTLLAVDPKTSGIRWMRVQAAADGAALVAWVEGDDQVHVAARSTGGTWGAARAVPGTQGTGTGNQPSLAANAAGRVVLGWAVGNTTYAAAGRIDGTFGAAQQLDGAESLSSAVLVAVGADGHAMVAVSKFDWWSTKPAPLFSLAPGSSTFEARGTTPAPINFPEAVVVGANGAGYVVAALFGTADEGDPTRWAVPFDATGRLGTPLVVANAEYGGDQLFAALDTRDRLHLVWRIEHDRNAEAYDGEVVTRSVANGVVGPIRSLGRSDALLYVEDVAGGGPEPIVGFTRGWYGTGDVLVPGVGATDEVNPTPTPVPTATPKPTATAVPTAKPTATPKPAPTATPAPTPKPVPTAIPVALSTPTPTATQAPAPVQPTAILNPGAIVLPVIPTTLAASTGTSPSAAVCRVPSVNGLSRAAALRRLARAGCRGTVVRKVQRRRAGQVTKQSPVSGERPAGFAVRLVVSR